MKAILKLVGLCVAALTAFVILAVWFAGSTGNDASMSEASALSQKDSAYVATILSTFNEMADSYDDISHVTLDGSIMDVHYHNRLSRTDFLADVRGISVSFSKKKLELLGVSGVTVRAVHDGYVMAQASARKGQVTEVQ